MQFKTLLQIKMIIGFIYLIPSANYKRSTTWAMHRPNSEDSAISLWRW